jgi:hypothetical protein
VTRYVQVEGRNKKPEKPNISLLKPKNSSSSQTEF